MLDQPVGRGPIHLCSSAREAIEVQRRERPRENRSPRFDCRAFGRLQWRLRYATVPLRESVDFGRLFVGLQLNGRFERGFEIAG